MVERIAEVTGRERDDVQRLLRDEFENPGITVARDFGSRGLTPHVFNKGMERFYSDSEAFLFESAVWNRNRAKRGMRKWIIRHLDGLCADSPQPLEVLCLGDGMGFDSAHIARAGHHVTYHEVPGPHERFARRLFEDAGGDVRIEHERPEPGRNSFDAVLCLDVLEHVPDPPAMVRWIAGLLRPGGRLIVHAPFYMIHPAYPTHLKANRRHSGSLALYRDAGLVLVVGRAGWNPIVVEKQSAGTEPRRHGETTGKHSGTGMQTSVRCRVIRLVGLYLALGRISGVPFVPVHWYRRRRQRWFGR